ncbi:hypothetical protein [Planctomicrobium piriforme]|uniref:Uncharacterized protein n=1 Tax=Planctomicrobium piriforme TaxID=1576369 RepID=A0A1I3D1U7_9PLAN|nr:hypothetical protein [Planctomicrobium piriforme]SFH80764.1 hypothetical protein SAMN05421753_10360 [Planctomicrobium piriforme]
MTRYAFAAALISAACLTAAAQAGNPGSPCGQMVTQAGPVPETATPPSAPAQGQTVQSRSIEPQAVPTVMQQAPVRYYGSNARVTNFSQTRPYARVGDIAWRRQHPGSHFQQQ